MHRWRKRDYRLIVGRRVFILNGKGGMGGIGWEGLERESKWKMEWGGGYLMVFDFWFLIFDFWFLIFAWGDDDDGWINGVNGRTMMLMRDGMDDEGGYWWLVAIVVYLLMVIDEDEFIGNHITIWFICEFDLVACDLVFLDFGRGYGGIDTWYWWFEVLPLLPF